MTLNELSNINLLVCIFCFHSYKQPQATENRGRKPERVGKRQGEPTAVLIVAESIIRKVWRYRVASAMVAAWLIITATSATSSIISVSCSNSYLISGTRCDVNFNRTFCVFFHVLFSPFFLCYCRLFWPGVPCFFLFIRVFLFYPLLSFSVFRVLLLTVYD